VYSTILVAPVFQLLYYRRVNDVDMVSLVCVSVVSALVFL
jgi:hypothetical protein